MLEFNIGSAIHAALFGKDSEKLITMSERYPLMPAQAASSLRFSCSLSSHTNTRNVYIYVSIL